MITNLRSRLALALLAAVLIMVAILATPSQARPYHSRTEYQQLTGYADPETVGFHHAALLYADQVGSAADVLPLVNRMRTDGSLVPGDSLYDAFLYLAFTIDGVSMDYGRSTKPQWLTALDLWFADGGALDQLEAAAEQAADAAAAAGVPQRLERRSVILMMPWMNPEVRSFGEVAGADRDLAIAAGRAAVAQWYAELARDRFAAKGYRHLDLWGLYRMREDITPFEQHVVRADADGVHAGGLKYLSIPYYDAPGWDNWEADGFDAAIMQPSYAFRAHPDGGRVDASRLEETAVRTAARSLGVEIEIRGCASMPVEQAMARQYLSRGSALGYQNAVSAAFLGAGLATCGAVTSADPAQRAIYDLVADYVSGVPVADPDVIIEPLTRSPLVHRFVVDDLAGLPGLRVDLDESAGTWTGRVTARVRPAGQEWRDVSWVVRGGGDAMAGDVQGIAVPIPARDLPAGPAEVQLSFIADDQSASPSPRVRRIVIDPAAADVTLSALSDGVVTVETPAPPEGSYPDPDGTRLSDGVVSSGGWGSGRNTGWESNPGQLAIQLDLGTQRAVGSVRLDSQGGSDAGVNWPLNPVVIFGERPVIEPEGVGPAAAHTAWRFGPPVITARHPSALTDLPHVPGVSCDTGTEVTCTNQDGHLIAGGQPITTRYLTVFASTNGWAMASELSVFDPNGQRIDADYRLVRVPGNLENYADDGQRLTDGRYVSDFAWRQLSGWPANQDVALRIDLPSARTIRTVTLWSASLPDYGIVAPDGFGVEVFDGAWHPFAGTVNRETFGVGGVRLSVSGTEVDGVTALRIRVPAFGTAAQWLMLSEITE